MTCGYPAPMDKKELYITASLAQLELNEVEAEALSKAVDEMLVYFSRMREIEVDDLEPTTHALLTQNRLRPDQVEESSLADRLVENAPETEDRFIVIPNVL
jgi:aspartyl-tRNA(Asn)/glutamyl-tRNA(Gln) amidotransferase subunit C